jgi:outer membrane protein TolC
MAAVVKQQKSEARLEIDAAESAYRAGRGNQADIYMARSALVGLDDRASEFERRTRTATTMLARWIGAAADAPLVGKPEIDRVRLNAQALDTELAHHPQIEALARAEQIAATEVKLADANKRPDWSVEVSYQQRGPAYSNMISVGVSVPLPWDQANRQDRELAAKLAMANQARAQREDSLRAHVAEARSMLIEWESGRERGARYELELVPLARERTAATVVAYRSGKSSLADVLAARRNEIEVRMQALQLEMDTARWWAQLNFLAPDDAAHGPTPTISLKDTP